MLPRKSVCRFLLVATALAPLNGCMKTVKRKRPVTKWRTVEKTRTVRKPVRKEVRVPVEERERVPVFREMSPSPINSSSSRMTIGFLPFSSASGRRSLATTRADQVESIVEEDPQFEAKYRIVDQARIKQTTRRPDLADLTIDDFPSLRSELGIQRLIAGHLKTPDSLLLRSHSTQSGEVTFSDSVTGSGQSFVERITEIFFGKRVQEGYRTETRTRYETEWKTVYEEVAEPYTEREQYTTEEEYTTQEVDWGSTFLLGLLVAAAVVGSEANQDDQN